MRGIAREEESLASRAAEIADAIGKEGADVAGRLLSNVSSDLGRIARDISAEGDYQTGERVQGLQRDVEEALLWLLDALRAEQARRQNEAGDQKTPGQQAQDQRQTLIPDSAELKLLRRMEIDLQQSVEQMMRLYPELGEDAEVELDPLLLSDVARLAARHQQITELFQSLRERVGIPAPGTAQD